MLSSLASEFFSLIVLFKDENHKITRNLLYYMQGFQNAPEKFDPPPPPENISEVGEGGAPDEKNFASEAS